MNSSLPVLRYCRPTGRKINPFLDDILVKLNTDQTLKIPTHVSADWLDKDEYQSDLILITRHDIDQTTRSNESKLRVEVSKLQKEKKEIGEKLTRLIIQSLKIIRR